VSTAEFGAVLLLGIAIGAVATLFALRNSVRELSARQRGTEAKLDAVMRNAGVSYDPYANVDPRVLEAIRAGKKIEAIKRYREASGADLKEAKDYVERIWR
jgi:ribosomal protein L7/L12